MIPVFKEMEAKIPAIYKPLLDFNDKNSFYVFYGGRGAGKSENIAQSLVIIAASKKVRILCIRETQTSISESVKSLIEKWINALDFSPFFRVTNTHIFCELTGSEFLFMGMRSHTAVNVKSINDISYTWIEEAEAFSQRSWDLLVPSVTRTENPKIIISFNPYKESDTIYKEFITNTPPKNSFIKKVNYTENPFFKNSYLEQLRADDEERLPAEVYRHRWLGEILTNIESSLFKNVDFTPMSFATSKIVEKIIACDPATTNKEHSNEYGVIVLGKLESGVVLALADYSSKFTPYEFGAIVNKASSEWGTDCVVVETNQGGDFIKSLLISVNPYLKIAEIRAGAGKAERALPVASLMELRKVCFGVELPQLKRQLELFTTQGYLGLKGESPDRADAFIHGVYFLAKISTKSAISTTLFNNMWFEVDSAFINGSYTILADAHYLSYGGGEYFYICADFLKKDNQLKILIKKCEKNLNADYLMETINGVKFIRNTPFFETIIQKHQCHTYEPCKEKSLDKKVMNILPICKENFIMIEKENNYFLNNEITEFKLESGLDFHFLDLFCDIIYTEFNLAKE